VALDRWRRAARIQLKRGSQRRCAHRAPNVLPQERPALARLHDVVDFLLLGKVAPLPHGVVGKSPRRARAVLRPLVCCQGREGVLKCIRVPLGGDVVLRVHRRFRRAHLPHVVSGKARLVCSAILRPCGPVVSCRIIVGPQAMDIECITGEREDTGRRMALARACVQVPRRTPRHSVHVTLKVAGHCAGLWIRERHELDESSPLLSHSPSHNARSAQVKSSQDHPVLENCRMMTSMWGFGTLSTRGPCGLEITCVRC
jgi:hypothetical protein